MENPEDQLGTQQRSVLTEKNSSSVGAVVVGNSQHKSALTKIVNEDLQHPFNNHENLENLPDNINSEPTSYQNQDLKKHTSKSPNVNGQLLPALPDIVIALPTADGKQQEQENFNTVLSEYQTDSHQYDIDSCARISLPLSLASGPNSTLSSDDEIFAECEAYPANTTQTFDKNLTADLTSKQTISDMANIPQWDNVVASFSGLNIENLENSNIDFNSSPSVLNSSSDSTTFENDADVNGKLSVEMSTAASNDCFGNKVLNETVAIDFDNSNHINANEKYDSLNFHSINEISGTEEQQHLKNLNSSITNEKLNDFSENLIVPPLRDIVQQSLLIDKQADNVLNKTIEILNEVVQEAQGVGDIDTCIPESIVNSDTIENFTDDMESQVSPELNTTLVLTETNEKIAIEPPISNDIEISDKIVHNSNAMLKRIRTYSISDSSDNEEILNEINNDSVESEMNIIEKIATDNKIDILTDENVNEAVTEVTDSSQTHKNSTLDVTEQNHTSENEIEIGSLQLDDTEIISQTENVLEEEILTKNLTEVTENITKSMSKSVDGNNINDGFNDVQNDPIELNSNTILLTENIPDEEPISLSVTATIEEVLETESNTTLNMDDVTVDQTIDVIQSLDNEVSDTVVDQISENSLNCQDEVEKIPPVFDELSTNVLKTSSDTKENDKISVTDNEKLDKTFAASTEALNSTVNFPNSKTRNCPTVSVINETVQISDSQNSFDLHENEFSENSGGGKQCPEVFDSDATATDNQIDRQNKFEATFDGYCSPNFGNTFKFPANFQNPPDFESNGESFSSASNEMILNTADFDYLLTKGNNIITVDRSSLLLRFDPLLGTPVVVNQQPDITTEKPKVQSNQKTNRNGLVSSNLSSGFGASSLLSKQLMSTVEEGDNINDLVINNITQTTNKSSDSGRYSFTLDEQLGNIKPKHKNKFKEQSQGNDKMSIDVVGRDMKNENDVLSVDNHINFKSDKYDINMEDLEKKIQNEVFKRTEDISKKLKDSEQREEALLKRITEKDKTTAKMGGVIEAYEKTIAEMIAEKEEITHNYERDIAEIKSDRDVNYQHLASLESTFADLHVKYERCKQSTAKHKSNEEELISERKKCLENLRLQEQRYEKMKTHAIQQLEIANNKLDFLTKNHSSEMTKLKAILKKEEISKLSMSEQLIQKSRENEELVKICDELINGQGN